MYDVLAIKISSTTIKTIENASTSNNIIFTQNELNTIYGLTTTDQSKDFTFELKTYENSSKTTQVGNTKTKTARGYIVGANPVINSKNVVDILQDTIDLTGDATKLIKYNSTAKISVNVSGVYQATISSVKINDSNATYNSISGNWELEIQNVETNSFAIEVRDSRNFPTVDNITATMIDYIPLTTNVTATRNQPTDGKINLVINGNYFNNTFGTENNVLSLKYRYVEYGGDISQETWNSLTPIITNNTYAITTQLSNFNYQKQYEFEVKAEDLLTIKDVTGIIIPKGIPVYNWEEDFFNINADIQYHGNSILEYSGTERLIGKWINNEPLYIKTITKSTSGGTNNIAKSDISNNLDKIIDIRGTTLQSSGNYSNLFYYNSATDMCFVYYSYTSSNLVIKCGSSYGFGTAYVTILYTKTSS